MGGEATARTAATAEHGAEGRVKSLGLVFEDEQKSSYSSGETVAGHVLLETTEPLALRALRLEAQGRARASWSQCPGHHRLDASGSLTAEVEYLNIRQSLREPAAGEAIPIYAEIENCSSRLIVPKAAIFQTQTYLASGKTKTFRQMVANVRGNHIASGSTDTWNGKTLKIPPVIPSILDCCIIRVDYSLAVYIHIPGAKKLMLELPLVIGTIPYNGFGSRNSSVVSQFGVDMSWLTLTLPEHPEAPPNYADVVSEEEFSRHIPPYPQPTDCQEEICCPLFAYIQEFRFQPPPLYSEVDPHPGDIEETQIVSFML
ncbi:arrestin domain-containing protein 4 isoform X2 [Sminthopsis crassicaudata]|uniref:arrestin domain-containing protein 4 isoform X2 n=1 Tax=Sminthopsis crassicaudata TaxID=9301 RepID=UPI003D6957D9